MFAWQVQTLSNYRSLITGTPAHLTSWLVLFLTFVDISLHSVVVTTTTPCHCLLHYSPSHSAHCVPFVVQKGIWIGSAFTPLATNLSLISLSLGLAVI